MFRTILNLKRQLRTKTILEMSFNVLGSIRRVLDDFQNFDFLGSYVGHLPEENFRGKLGAPPLAFFGAGGCEALSFFVRTTSEI